MHVHMSVPLCRLPVAAEFSLHVITLPLTLTPLWQPELSWDDANVIFPPREAVAAAVNEPGIHTYIVLVGSASTYIHHMYNINT